MQKSEVKDLTVGSPMKLILSFAVPMLLGFLFQQFYNMVDTIIVGKCLGVSSLAAVGSTGSINFMIIGFCTGACSGFAIPVAQKFGAGDYKGMRKFVANAGWLSAVFAVVMTTVVGALCMNILQWMNTPEDIIQGAYDYIFVIFLGIPVTYLYNMLAGIIRSLGDSKTPVYFLLLSSLLNIGLDFFTILGLGMGVGGPALATESLLEEITVAEDVEEVGGVSGVVEGVVLSAGEIDSGHVEGEFQGDPSFESDVRIEFILEIGPLGVDQAVFFVGKLVFF